MLAQRWQMIILFKLRNNLDLFETVYFKFELFFDKLKNRGATRTGREACTWRSVGYLLVVSSLRSASYLNQADPVAPSWHRPRNHNPDVPDYVTFLMGVQTNVSVFLLTFSSISIRARRPLYFHLRCSIIFQSPNVIATFSTRYVNSHIFLSISCN